MKISQMIFGLFVVGCVLILSTDALAAPKRKVLFLTKSAGFMHDVVNRKKECSFNEKGEERWKELAEPAPLAFAELTLTKIGKDSGAFEVTCTQNPADINAENLKNYDAVFFYTTSNLGFSAEQKTAFLDFIKSGKAFGGAHCATDTFYEWKEYGDLIGGYFDGHPWHENVTIKVEDTKHPACKHLGESFVIKDEIYQFKNWSRDNKHVLMSLDAAVFDVSKGKRADKDYGIAWTNTLGKGRMFYTALGHRGDVWNDPRFQKHVLNGILWAMGDLK